MGSGAGGRAWGSGDGLERRAAVSPFRGGGLAALGDFFYKSLFSCALRGEDGLTTRQGVNGSCRGNLECGG